MNKIQKHTGTSTALDGVKTKPLGTPIGALKLGLVMDESGSMDHLRETVLRAVNRLVRQQAELSPQAEVSVITFSTKIKPVRDDTPIAAVSDLSLADYSPHGGTALYDGIGEMIKSVGSKVGMSMTPVIIAIVSDGEENSSQTFSQAQILEQITYRRFACGWQFLFLSSSQSAARKALDLGIPKSSIIEFANDAEGITSVLDRLSQALSAFRLGDKRAMLKLKDRN